MNRPEPSRSSRLAAAGARTLARQARVESPGVGSRSSGHKQR